MFEILNHVSYCNVIRYRCQLLTPHNAAFKVAVREALKAGKVAQPPAFCAQWGAPIELMVTVSHSDQAIGTLA